VPEPRGRRSGGSRSGRPGEPRPERQPRDVQPGAGRRAKLVPLGHDQPFDPIPKSNLGDDGEAHRKLWDDTIERKHAGMLDAPVVNGSAE
jgi:hypothetical protein